MPVSCCAAGQLRPPSRLRSCRRAGVHSESERVESAQRLLLWAAWWIYGLWDSIWVYKVRRLRSGECAEGPSLRGELSARNAPLLTDDQFYACEPVLMKLRTQNTLT